MAPVFPGRPSGLGAERINYYLLFPGLLVANLAVAPLRDPALVRLGSSVFATILVITAAIFVLGRWRGWGPERLGVIVQGAIRFNTYLGLAIVGSLAGPEKLSRAAVLLAIAVPTVNVLSVYALSAREEVGVSRLLGSLLSNPLIIACIIGITIAASGVALPESLARFLGILASASLPLGLLCVGAALLPEAARRESATLTFNAAARLLLTPLVAFLAARLFGLGPLETVTLIVFAAIPTAPAAYVLTVQMKGDATLMAGIVTVQTALALLTLPLVLALIG